MFNVDKVDGVEMKGVVAKAEGRGSIALRQPIPDRPELEQRFTEVLVCHLVQYSFEWQSLVVSNGGLLLLFVQVTSSVAIVVP